MNWLNAYRALLNLGLAPIDADGLLADAREAGFATSHVDEVAVLYSAHGASVTDWIEVFEIRSGPVLPR